MIAITTNSSIRVKALDLIFIIFLILCCFNLSGFRSRTVKFLLFQCQQHLLENILAALMPFCLCRETPKDLHTLACKCAGFRRTQREAHAPNSLDSIETYRIVRGSSDGPSFERKPLGLETGGLVARRITPRLQRSELATMKNLLSLILVALFVSSLRLRKRKSC